jgi:hypothetical protein
MVRKRVTSSAGRYRGSVGKRLMMAAFGHQTFAWNPDKRARRRTEGLRSTFLVAGRARRMKLRKRVR